MNSIVDDIFKYVAHSSQQACGMHHSGCTLGSYALVHSLCASVFS